MIGALEFLFPSEFWMKSKQTVKDIKEAMRAKT